LAVTDPEFIETFRQLRQNRAEKGLAVEKRIVGSDVVESANCFGDHYTRTGIDVPTRELLTLSMLVSLGGCEAQVMGHVAANLNVGNGRARLIGVLTQLLPFIGYPRTLNALRAVDEVAATSGSKETL
jgi:4-carboxymuconolactone decarboxylase